jgi:lipoprotein-anchoring transpeptidase ErfK/SrfK
MVRNIGLYASLAGILVGLVVPPFARAAEIIQVPETELSMPGDDELDASLQPAQFFGQDVPFFRWFWQGNPAESRRPQRQGAPRHRLASPSGSAGVPTTRSHRGARSYQRHIAGLLTKPYSGPLAKGPVLITVSLSKQSLSVYDAGMRVAQSQISSGVATHPTPMGIFTILERQSWHTSNIYSGAPMPLMQRLTWSGIALHAGVVPGYPASHGCIRLPEAFALRLWHTARVGARVIVSRDEAELAPISHPLLPQPAVPLPQPAPVRPDSEPSLSDAPAVSLFLPPPGDEADAERDYLMTTSDETDDPSREAASQSDEASFQYAIALSSDELIALSRPPNADLLQVASRKRLSSRAAPEASYYYI